MVYGFARVDEIQNLERVSHAPGVISLASSCSYDRFRV